MKNIRILNFNRSFWTLRKSSVTINDKKAFLQEVPYQSLIFKSGRVSNFC